MKKQNGNFERLLRKTAEMRATPTLTSRHASDAQKTLQHQSKYLNFAGWESLLMRQMPIEPSMPISAALGLPNAHACACARWQSWEC